MNKFIKKTLSTFLIVSFFLFNSPFTAYAAQCRLTQHINFCPLDIQSTNFTLHGIKEKNVLFKKAYSIEFYRAEYATPKEILSNIPKTIKIKSYSNISGEKLGAAIDKRIDKYLDEHTFKQMEHEIDTLRSLLVDLNPGDNFNITYFPGIGTQFYYNENLTGTIEGTDFAKTLFTVWLDDPSIKTVKS